MRKQDHLWDYEESELLRVGLKAMVLAIKEKLDLSPRSFITGPITEENEMKTETIMTGVSEDAEGFDVKLIEIKNGDVFIDATNEGGFNGTLVNLRELLAWLRKHRPELLDETTT